MTLFNQVEAGGACNRCRPRTTDARGKIQMQNRELKARELDGQSTSAGMALTLLHLTSGTEPLQRSDRSENEGELGFRRPFGWSTLSSS